VSSKKRIIAGKNAYKNGTGIHGLSKEQKIEIAKKGNQAFLERHQSAEYKEIHSQRIRLGKLASRLKKAHEKLLKDKTFGFY
jgi:hypothetical protein